jgi:predicted amidohydrolase
MSNMIRIVTSSFATLEDTRPPFNLRHPTLDENLRTARSILETAAAFKPDLVLLPEAFPLAGMPLSKVPEVAETIPGPTFEMLAAACRAGNFNLVAGHVTAETGKYFNQALVLDRVGKLVGTYRKNYPVEEEIRAGIEPGSGPAAFDLDFGRIGVAVCFDLNWPELWSGLERQNIDFACWISAYEGGFPIKNYAWTHLYPIVSSVWPYHARVTDITGEVLASTSRWSRVAMCDLNLDRELLHTDLQMDKIAQIQARYGSDVTVKTYTEEHLILLESMAAGLNVREIMEEFGLVSYRDYIARCTECRNQVLGQAHGQPALFPAG